MPGSVREVGRYSWIVARPPGTTHFRRYQWLGAAQAKDSDNPFSYFGNGAVAVHGIVSGEPQKVLSIMACLERETARYNDANCGCWPGPNANTFADGLIRECGLGIELPATAVGKDYRGPVGVSTTEGRTGVQLDTWVGGLTVGLKEGIVANLTGISLGVHFWPPGLEVPVVGNGRVGVDTSLSIPQDPTVLQRDVWPAHEAIHHQVGVGSLSIALGYDRVANPAAAGGLSDRSLASLHGRAVLGKRVGYAFGFDVAVGATAPLGVAYSTHLYPVGVGAVLGDLGFVGVFSGIGTSGASSTVRGALELPQELRVELDIARVARLGLHGGVVVVPDATNRRTLETFWGATTRLGTRASGRGESKDQGAGTGGFFIGLERRELQGSFLLGASFGYEIGYGG
jgi:hypothetical protein